MHACKHTAMHMCTQTDAHMALRSAKFPSRFLAAAAFHTSAERYRGYILSDSNTEHTSQKAFLTALPIMLMDRCDLRLISLYLFFAFFLSGQTAAFSST